MNIACIPAYNEESTIAEIVKNSLNFVDQVIVCDDGSTDSTAEFAKKAGSVVISHKKKQGYGAALISLFEYARQKNVQIMVTLDGDGQHDPKQIPLLIDALTHHNIDVVIGTRHVNSDTTIPKYRKHGIKIITSTVNYGTNMKIIDSQSGFRAYSKNAVSSIHPTEKGMAISTEILLKISNNGLSLAEVPVTISYNSTSEYNAISHGISVLVNTLKYVSIKHPLKFYGISGIILIIAGIIMSLVFVNAYINTQIIFYGSFLSAIILFLSGSILAMTAIILFSISNIIRDRY